MNESQDQSQSLNELTKVRYQKLKAYREQGIEPFPVSYEREHTLAHILETCFPEGKEVLSETLKTAGRVTTIRAMGKAAFFTIQDETTKMQVYANDKTLSEQEHYILKNLDIGDIVGITGNAFLTKTEEKSIRASELKLLSKNLSPMPVRKEKEGEVYDAFADVENRYRKRYLDLAVNPEVRENFRTRFKIIAAIRKFMTDKGFLEVETPMMQSVASGAAARPFETWHNTLERKLYLRIAPELYLKRLIVGGFEKVFELNRNFRNEGISTKHNPEFTMMEVYQAYADFRTMMQLTEDLFLYVADSVFGRRKFQYGEVEIDFEKGWQKRGYLQCIKEETGIDFEVFLNEREPSFEQAKKLAADAKISVKEANTFWEVVDIVFSEKVEPKLIQPVFITDFPAAISPLAKNAPGNPFIVERFEPYILGREMGNAFSELNDPDEQLVRFQGQLDMKEAGAEETMPLDEDFIEALRVGMPPTGGLGIGIDRLVMLFTNSASIKDVILFPMLRTKGK